MIYKVSRARSLNNLEVVHGLFPHAEWAALQPALGILEVQSQLLRVGEKQIIQIVLHPGPGVVAQATLFRTLGGELRVDFRVGYEHWHQMEYLREAKEIGMSVPTQWLRSDGDVFHCSDGMLKCISESGVADASLEKWLRVESCSVPEDIQRIFHEHCLLGDTEILHEARQIYPETPLALIEKWRRQLHLIRMEMQAIAELRKDTCYMRHSPHLAKQLTECIASEQFKIKYITAKSFADPGRVKSFKDAEGYALDKYDSMSFLELAKFYISGDGVRQNFHMGRHCLETAKELDPKGRCKKRRVDYTRAVLKVVEPTVNIQRFDDEALLGLMEYIADRVCNLPQELKGWLELLRLFGFAPPPECQRPPLDMPCFGVEALRNLFGGGVCPVLAPCGLWRETGRIPERLRPKLQRCWHCFQCAKKMQKCVICATHYCSRACQKADYMKHQPVCKMMFARQIQPECLF